MSVPISTGARAATGSALQSPGDRTTKPRLGGYTSQPPSTVRVWPVFWRASSVARIEDGVGDVGGRREALERLLAQDSSKIASAIVTLMIPRTPGLMDPGML